MKHQQILASIGVGMLASMMSYSSQADPALRTLTVGGQTPQVASPAGQVFFPVAITRSGAGSLNVSISITGLPNGVTASIVPPDMSFTDQSPSTKHGKLLMRVPATVRQGSYEFVVTARKGNSPASVNSTNTLVVGVAPLVIVRPVLNSPVMQTDGTVLVSGSATANQPVVIEACSDLSTGVWQPVQVELTDAGGAFSIIDQDAPLYPVRFYRVSQ